MSIRSGTLLLLLLSVACGVGCSPRHSPSVARATPRGDPKLIVSAQQLKPGTGILHFSLTNIGNTPIELRRADLPTYQRTLLAVALNSSNDEALNRRFLLETAPPGRIQIPAGASVTTDLDLNGWFPSLIAVLRTSDVVVLWRYRVTPDRVAEPTEIYGGITLHRR